MVPGNDLHLLFACDWDHLRDWLLSLPPKQQQAVPGFILKSGKFGGVSMGKPDLMTIVGVTFTLAWFALGVPGALILGVIAGILTIIPDLGPAIAAGLAIIVALIEGSTYLPVSNFWFALMVWRLFGPHQHKNLWITHAYLYSVHMHDGIVFVAIIVAVVIWGILGHYCPHPGFYGC
jgi:predicted PurR-regulated permease PerM